MRFEFQLCAAIALAATTLGLAARSLSAQITWEQDYRGKKISCGVSGLQGFGDSCGFQYYDASFVGRIISVEELPADEFRLVVSPTEIFKGDLAATVILTTRSGACMPEFVIGQEWLFSAQRDKKSGELLLWFGTPGGPADKSEKSVERFQLLAQLQDSGMIVGEVSGLCERCANHKVIVRSIPDGVEHIAITDSDGRFAFPPLPTGRYRLDPNAAPGLWSGDGGETTVEAHECRDYHIAMLMDGSIAGSVILPNGDTSRTWNVNAVPVDSGDSSAASAFTDDQGHFELRGLKPGRYVLGIEVVGVSSRYDLKFGVYAPGVRDSSAAEVIELGKNEKRTGVDIHIPGDALKPSVH